MDDWNAVKELGAYLGLGIDDRMAEKLSCYPDSRHFLELLRLSTGDIKKRYSGEDVNELAKAIKGTDFKKLSGEGEIERRKSFSRDVFGRFSRSLGIRGDEEAFGEFDVVFQRFISRFKATLEGVMSVLGLKKEQLSLENTGIKEYLTELKELPCRRLGELNLDYPMQGGTAMAKYTEKLLGKYRSLAISEENYTSIVEIMNRLSGYPTYYKTMGAQEKLIETRPLLLAISELQLYHATEASKSDLLAALSILLFNIFPAPRLLKFISKFEPCPENDDLSYEYNAVMALNNMLAGKLDEAIRYNERALNFAMDEQKRAYTYILSSCILLNRYDPEGAINALYKCTSLTRNGRMRALAQFYMGIIHYENGDVSKALEAFNMSRTGLEDELDLMNVCNNIGTCAMIQGDLKTAIRSFESVDEMGRYMSSNSAKSLKSVAYGNLGIVYMSMMSYDMAMEYYKKAITLHKETHNKRGVANQLGNIGLTLKCKQDYKLSMEYFKSALNFSSGIDYLEGVLFAFGQIEQLMALQGKYDEAEAYKKDLIKRNPDIAKMLKK